MMDTGGAPRQALATAVIRLVVFIVRRTEATAAASRCSLMSMSLKEYQQNRSNSHQTRPPGSLAQPVRRELHEFVVQPATLANTLCHFEPVGSELGADLPCCPELWSSQSAMHCHATANTVKPLAGNLRYVSRAA